MSIVDDIINFLDTPLCGQDEPQPLHNSEEYESRFQQSGDCLELIAEELTGLNGDEVSRFDSWANKGAAMLGASGLLLSLYPLGMPLVETKQEFLGWADFCLWAIALILFTTAMGAFFMSTWNSLISLRRRPLCRTDEDEWLGIKDVDAAVLRKRLAASKMVTYKNNIIIVNEKATKVNEAWTYFFSGCTMQFVFLCVALLRGGT